jgi:predicted KAP-like P-loop ATPase
VPGQSKSSILNLFHEHLKTRYREALIVSFNPWLVSGTNDLASKFVAELLGINMEPISRQRRIFSPHPGLLHREVSKA